MTSVTDILSRVKARTRTVRVCLDGELLGQIDDLTERIRQAKQRDLMAGESLADEAPILIADRSMLNRQADETATAFSLTAVAGEILDDLKRQYPPDEEQWHSYRAQASASPLTATAPEFNYDEVLPRLVGLSMASIDGEPVEWTAEDGLALWAKLADGPRADLAGAAWDVNNRSSARPTSGIGTDTTPTSDPESTTQANGASHTASSPDGL